MAGMAKSHTRFKYLLFNGRYAILCNITVKKELRIMKKVMSVIAICIIACLTVIFSGCSKTADLYDLGLQMTIQMEELVKSDYYAELAGLNDSMKPEREKFIANDYDTPVKVFSISILDSKKILENLGEISEDKWNALNPSIQEQILNKVSMQTILNYVNFKYNSGSTFAVISNYTAKKQFENYSLKENIVYLYMFETGTPVAVTFTGYNGGIEAQSQFLLLPQTSTLSDIRELFTPFGCNVNVVNI